MNTLFIKKLKKWITLSILITSIYQIAFHFSPDAMFALFIVITAWIVYNNSVFKYSIFSKFPMSSFLVFGFVVSQYIFPLLFTTLEMKSIVNNLERPNLVFVHSFLALLAVLIGQYIYMNLKNKITRQTKLTKVFYKAGFFKIPTDGELWIMGTLGLLSMFFIYFIIPSAGEVASGAGQKFIQGFVPFTYAPFFIFLKKKQNIKSKNYSFFIKITVFVLLLFIVAIGRNSRGAFMFGFSGLAFYYLLGLILGYFKPTIFTKKNFIIAVVGLYLLLGPLSDLATAMVIVRGQRGDITRTELLYKTLEVYNDKDALQNRDNQIDLNNNSTEWSEYYLDDKFLSRFCNLKYNDNSLDLSVKIGEFNKVFLNYEINSTLSTFPQPIINFIGLNVNKELVNSMSHGDYLYFLGSGNSSALGGFRVGHFAGVGMVAFSWFYLPLLCFLCIPLFYVLDSFVLIYRNNKTFKSESIISYAIIIPITTIFMFFPFESISSIIAYLLRGWVQTALLYWILIKLTRLKLN